MDVSVWTCVGVDVQGRIADKCGAIVSVIGKSTCTV